MTAGRSARFQLTAAVLAVLSLALAVLCALQLFKREIVGMETRPSLRKDLGLAIQKEAFLDASILPVYGSSELTEPVPNRPDLAFRDAPTGFRVCPVGQAGNNTLLMAEKLAALGPVLEGKKVVVLLSGSWFRRRGGVKVDRYAGNFSYLQALRIARNDWLGDELTQRFARRMLEFPTTLQDHPDLTQVLNRLAKARKGRSMKGSLSMALLGLKELELRVADTFSMTTDLFGDFSGAKPVVTTRTGVFDGFEEPPADALPANRPPGKVGWCDDYIEMSNASHEWPDFELLLDTLQHLKAQTLVMTIPIDGVFDDYQGISFGCRRAYYDRVADACARRGCTFAEFPAHDRNPGFLTYHMSHPSKEGWTYMNQVLDDFYHDRAIVTEPAKPAPAQKIETAVQLSGPLPSPPPNDEMARAKPGQLWSCSLPGGVKMDFCFCPPGDFVMGSPLDEVGRDVDEGPVDVYLTQGFWLARTECTQAQWGALMSMPHVLKIGAQLPVDEVTWKSVIKFTRLFSQKVKLPSGWAMKLPTEAQWEYACRAGSKTVFSFGNQLNGTAANCYGEQPYGTSAEGPSVKVPSIPGAYPPNAWGLCDMHGNMWEWCADWYAPVLAGGVDPRGPAVGGERVIRGGSWGNFATHCRAAYRNSSPPYAHNTRVGFRPVLIYIGKDAAK